MSLKKIIIAV